MYLLGALHWDRSTVHYATAWKAHDAKLDRLVAVKIPRREQLDSVEAEEFLPEAHAAAQLKQPNIVSVHEVGRVNQGHGRCKRTRTKEDGQYRDHGARHHRYLLERLPANATEHCVRFP